MRLIRLVLFFLLPPVMLSSTGVAKGQSSLDAFVPFNEFVASVRAADSGSYLGRSGASVESATAFEEMRKHVLSLYDGVAATNSFLIDSGYVDCIPILQQPTARWLGLTEVPAPPPSPIKRTDQRPRPHTPLLLELGLSDNFGNRIACDVGTIPMSRLTLEQLCHFRNLREALQKGQNGSSPPPPSFVGADYRHSVGSEAVNNYGAESWLNVWTLPISGNSPGVPHSISQMWIFRQATPSSPLQTAEVGLFTPMAYKNQWATVLFIYWTADGYNATGCYNTWCQGFLQTSNTVVIGGTNWPNGSVAGGEQVIFDVEYECVKDANQRCNWWLAHDCDRCYIGYYPAAVYNIPQPPPAPPKVGPMTQYADSIEFGGESFVAHTQSNLFPPMGSGAYASAGAGHAAFQSSIIYFDLSFHIFRPTLFTSNDSSCFSIQCGDQNCDTFLFGGPGGNSC